MALSVIKTNSIAADAITAALIAPNTIVAADLAADSVDSSELVDGAIDTSHIANLQVTLAKMAVNSIDSDQYVDASIDLAHMSVNSIDSDQYVDGSIDNAHVAAGLDAVKLADGTVTNAELQYINTVSSNVQTQLGTKAVLTAVQTYTAGQRAEITALTSGTTITIDMADSNHFSVTLAHNATFANPSNDVAGQTGSIFITQDGTGSRTASWGTDWEFAGGTAPTLTTTAAAVDRIDYVVRTATSIQAVATLALA
jgi:hypothetical protein